jgi:hypothetical protein
LCDYSDGDREITIDVDPGTPEWAQIEEIAASGGDVDAWLAESLAAALAAGYNPWSGRLWW